MNSLSRKTFRLLFFILIGPVGFVPTIAKGCMSIPLDNSSDTSLGSFDGKMSPFGSVCLIARRRPDPSGSSLNPVIELQLIGKRGVIQDLPSPDRSVWNIGCRKIKTARIIDDISSKFSAIVVIGECSSANDEFAQPLVYLRRSGSFDFDEDISLSLSGIGEVSLVIKKIKRNHR